MCTISNEYSASPYGMFKPYRTLCPQCLKEDGINVKMFYIAPLDPALDGVLPAFWFCFACRYIAQVGVGRVELQKEDKHGPVPDGR